MHCKLPLREHGTRLVCDDCGAILIELSDLESACTDLDTEHVRLALGDRTAAPEQCPRCELPMQAAALYRGRAQILPRVIHCAKHGAWLPGGVLAQLFALIGHRAPPRASDEHTGGLRIGHWLSRARPRERTTASDPYASQRLGCPADGTALAFAGDRHGCAACGGVLIGDAALAELIGEMLGAPFELAPPSGAAIERVCPVCGDPMRAETFATAQVLRCASHGVWFAAGAMEQALAHLAGAPPTLGGGFWSKLFRR